MDMRRSTPTLSDGDADLLLSGQQVAGHGELQATLALLRSSMAATAPSPNDALAAVLRDGLVVAPAVTAGGAWRRRAARAVVAVTAVLGSTFLAATANALPAAVQSTVADVVGSITPLELPRPTGGPARPAGPPDVSVTPVPVPGRPDGAGTEAPAAPADAPAVTGGPAPQGEDRPAEDVDEPADDQRDDTQDERGTADVDEEAGGEPAGTPDDEDGASAPSVPDDEDRPVDEDGQDRDLREEPDSEGDDGASAGDLG